MQLCQLDRAWHEDLTPDARLDILELDMQLVELGGGAFFFEQPSTILRRIKIGS
jgi:hypothetical protein